MHVFACMHIYFCTDSQKYAGYCPFCMHLKKFKYSNPCTCLQNVCILLYTLTHYMTTDNITVNFSSASSMYVCIWLTSIGRKFWWLPRTTAYATS